MDKHPLNIFAEQLRERIERDDSEHTINISKELAELIANEIEKLSLC